MSLTRQQKETRVKETADAIGAAGSVVFVAYNGLSVADVEELRANLHAAAVSLRVIPKRLLKIALSEAKIDFDPTAIDGQVAIAWGSDPVLPAKIIYEFAKNNDAIKISSGVMEGQVLDQDEVTALAQLPGSDQLLAQLVSVLAGPSRGFVNVLIGVQRNMVYVLQAIAEKKS